MEYYFPDNDQLVIPFEHLHLKYKTDITSYLGMFDNLSYKEGYKLLYTKVREVGENIPPLIYTYMNFSPTMRMFGTALNDEFGEVEETGIMITLADVYPAKKERHMSTYDRDKNHTTRSEERRVGKECR